MKNRKFWKIFLLALLTSTALTGGGVALYLYLTKPTKPIDKKPNDDKGDKNNNELETKWYNFIKEVKETQLDKIEWAKLSDLKDWAQLIDLLEKQLKTLFETKHQLGDIKNKLNIELFDGTKKLDGLIGRWDNTKKITIKLSHLDDQNLKEPLTVTTKIKLALSTRWSDFIKEVKETQLDKIEWAKLSDLKDWAQLIDLLEKQLKTLFETKHQLGDIKNKLKIELFDGTKKLDGLIGRWDNTKKITIKLSRLDDQNLKEPLTVTTKIKLALSTRWSDFIKEVKETQLDQIEWAKLSDLKDWAQLIDLLEKQLKTLFETKHQLGDIKNKLKIELFDGTKKLDGLIGRWDNTKKITIKLSRLDDQNLKEPLTVTTKIKLALSTRWSDFIKEVKETQLDQIEWAKLSDLKDWAQLIKLLEKQLKTLFETKHQLGDIKNKLNIELFDGTKKLDGLIGRWDNTKKITIKLSHLDDQNLKEPLTVTTKIKLALSTRWSDFIKEVKETQLDKIEWAKLSDLKDWAQLIKLLEKQLKTLFETKHQLGDIKNKLNIELFDGTKKLDGLIGRWDNTKKITIKLSHLDDQNLKEPLTVTTKIKLALSTRWSDFIKEVKETQLDKIEWAKLSDLKDWAQLIKLLEKQLKTLFETKHQLGDIKNKLKIELFDGTKKLDGLIGRWDNTKKITIKLSHLDDQNLKEPLTVTTKIKLALSTRWSDFIKEVKETQLDQIEWAKLSDLKDWAQLIKLLEKQLKTLFETKHQLGDIKNKLKIELFDGTKKLDGLIGRWDNTKKITIKLSHLDDQNLKEPLTVTTKIKLALSTRWSDFIKEVKETQLDQIEWAKLSDLKDWAQLIDLLEKQLKTLFETKHQLGDIKNKLKIELFDGTKKLDGLIGRWDNTKKITIKLSHLDDQNLKEPLTVTTKINLALSTRWSDFIKEVKETQLDQIEWAKLSDLKEWAQLIKLLEKQLKTLFETKHQLGDIKNKLNIELFDGTKKLDGLIGRWDNTKKITIKLSHLDDQNLKEPLTVTTKIKLALSTRWSDFIKEVKETQLDKIEWAKLSDLKDWAQLIKLLEKQLKTLFETKHQLGDIKNKLNIELFDGTKKLDGLIGRWDNTKKITIKLSHLDDQNLKEPLTVTTKINLALSTRWSDFIKEVKETQLDQIEWAKLSDLKDWAQLIKLLEKQLKTLFETKHQLGDIKNKLKIELFDGTKKLDGLIGRWDNTKKITIKLSHLDDQNLKEPLTVTTKIKLALSTRWSDFIKEVKETQLDQIEWAKLSDLKDWAQLIDLLEKQLKTLFETKHQLGDIKNKLKIELFDGTKKLDGLIGRWDNTKKITIKLSHLDDQNLKEPLTVTTKINLALSTRWSDFIKEVKETQLDQIEWAKLSDLKDWAQLIDLLEKQLKTLFETKHQLGDIKNKLKIELFDGTKKLDGLIGRWDNTKKITIKLSHLDDQNLKEPLTVTTKINLALSTRWSDFIKEVKETQLDKIEWAKLSDLKDWAQLIDLLEKQLKTLFETKHQLGDIKNKLKIELFDGTKKLDGLIGRWDNTKKITIKLSHLDDQNLKEPLTVTTKINLALSTRWSDFIKEVKETQLDKIEWAKLSDLKDWAQLIDLLEKQLKTLFETKHQLGDIKNKLKIELFDGTKKLDGLIGRWDNTKKITIKLSHLDDQNLKEPLTVTTKINLALSTRWSDFIKEVKETQLDKIEWAKLSDLKDWAQLIDLLEKQLKTLFETKHQLGDIKNKLKIELFDGTKKLDGLIGRWDNTKKITIKLSHLDDQNLKEPLTVTTKINLALSTRWSDFIKEVKETQLDKIEWAKLSDLKDWAQLIKLLEKQLKTLFETKHQLGDIKNKLKIELFDGTKKLDGLIGRWDNTKKITIKLSHLDDQNLKEPLTVTTKINLALSTRWSDFIKEVKETQLDKIEWAKLSDLKDWAQLIKLLEKQLKTLFETKHQLGDIKNKLKIELFDGTKKLDGLIGRWDNTKKITIKLSHLDDQNLKEPLTVTTKIKLALSTRWSDFIKEVKETQLDQIEWAKLSDLKDWAQLIDLLEKQLKTLFETKHQLGDIKNKLKIELFDGTKKLDGLIGRWDNTKKITIKLSHLDDQNLKEPLTVTTKINLALSTRWSDFIKEVKETQLDQIEWAKLSDLKEWAQLIKLLEKQLKTLFETKHQLGDIKNKLNIELFDGTKKLDGLIGRWDNTKKITIKLSHLDDQNLKEPLTVTTKIKLALSTRWSDFIKEVKETQLDKIEWAKLSDLKDWAQLIKLLEKQLKTLFETKHQLGDIKNKLKIELFDGTKKLDGLIGRWDNTKKITIKLSHLDDQNLKEPLTVTTKIKLALSTRWSDFIKEVKETQLDQIEWAKLSDLKDWAQLIKLLEKQLKTLFETKHQLGDIKNKLKIELFDGTKKLDGLIGRWDNTKKITIKLSHLDDQNLKEPLTVTTKIKLALSTRWSDFIKEVKETQLDQIEWAKLSDLKDWAQLIDLLEKQLKTLFETKHQLGDIKNKLKIELFDGTKKLDGLIGRWDNTKKITIKLSHLDDQNLKEPLTVTTKINLALSTRWSDFIKEVKETQLDQIEWAKLSDLKDWAQLIDLLEKQLKTLFETKHQLGDIKNKLKIELFDGTKKLDGLIGRWDNTKKITIKLSHLDDQNLKEPLTVTTKINLALSTRWSDFINHAKTKELLESIDWSKITESNSYKDLIPLFREKLKNLFENTHNLGDISKLSINLFTLQITPLIDQKIGQVWNKEIMVRLKMISDSNEFLKGDINTKIKIKLDLHALTKLFKRLVNDKQPDNVEELKRFLQEMFDYHYPLYKVDAENDLIVSINPPIFNRESAGNFSIRPKNNTKFKNSSINNVIPYYEKFRISLVLFRNALTKILDDSPIENRQELDNIIKKLLDEGGFNKYKKQNIINFNDLDITFKPDDNTTWIKISIALNKKQSWKAISNTPILIDTKHKFYRTFENFKAEFQQYKNLASLRKHLEDQDSYDTWEKLEEIARKWVKDKYASEYKQIFDIANLDVHYFSKQNKLIGKISDIYYEKKEFSGLIFIRLQAANLLYSHYQQINFKLNLSTLNIEDPKYNLKSFIDRLLEKDANNDKETFVNAFINKLNQIQGFENKFSKTDFNFVFKPATKKNNKIEIKITPINKTKIKGNISTYNYYEKYMIDLNDKDIEQDIQKLIKENEPDNQEVLDKHLQAYFDSKYNDYDIDVKNHLYITFDKPTFNNLKDGDLNISADQSVRKFKNKLFIIIPYYDKYKIDFVEFHKTLVDKLIYKTPNNKDELNQTVKEVLDTYSFNKYNNQKIIDFTDLIIDYDLKKPITNALLLEITISLKQDKKLKSKTKPSLEITLVPNLVSQYRDFVKDLNNNLNSLKQFLEKQTYTSWSDIIKTAKDYLIKNYANNTKYKELFDNSKSEIDFFEDDNLPLNGQILASRKEFNGKIQIRLLNNDFSFDSINIAIKFKIKLNALVDLEDYAKKINNEDIGMFVYKLNYHFNSKDFNSDLEEKIKEFFDNNKLNGSTPEFNILDKDKLNFKLKDNSISIKLTYQGFDKTIKLNYFGQKLNLSKYKIDGAVWVKVNPILGKDVFKPIDKPKSFIIYEFVEKIKEIIRDFNGIDVDKYKDIFTFKDVSNVTTLLEEQEHDVDFTSTLDEVEGKIRIRVYTKVHSFQIEELVNIFLIEQKKKNPKLFDFDLKLDHKFYFNENGLKTFDHIKAQYQDRIATKINDILNNDDLWFAKILRERDIESWFSFDNFSFTEDFSFKQLTELTMHIKYNGTYQGDRFYSKEHKIVNLLNISITNTGLSNSDVSSFFDDLDKNQKEYSYEITSDENTIQTKTKIVKGLMTDEIDDWIDVKELIEKRLVNSPKKINLLANYLMIWSPELSSNENGYFYYFPNHKMVLNVFVDSYNNDGDYKRKQPNLFYSGKIRFKLWYVNNSYYNQHKIYNWTSRERTYNLINKVEYDWYSWFKKKLDNGNNRPNSWQFSESRKFSGIFEYIYKENILWNSPEKWKSIVWEYNGAPFYYADDYIHFIFALTKKDESGRILQKLPLHLKLGGTGDWRIINSLRLFNVIKFPDFTIGQFFNNNKWTKIDLKFRLYRWDGKLNDKNLLPIAQDEKYIINTYK